MSSTRGLLADVIESSAVDGPGNRYVVFLQGCSFDCLACHNPQTICRRATSRSRWVDVETLVREIAAVAPFLSGVTVSGGEATLQWEFVHELFRRLGAEHATAHLSRLVDTNGDAEPFVWEVLAPVIEGAMVDLKAIDPEVHHFLTGHGNDRVIAALRHLDRLGRLTEVRLLIVPGVNDRPDHLEATAALLTSLSVPPSVKVLAFRHDGTREVARRFAEATPDDVDAVAAILTAHGLGVQRPASSSAR
jgi:pyruvate formate lyase activating enzyme